MLVAALAAHRAAAFEAVRLLMDYLKTDAPLWKKETGPDGARWIEPTDHDHARRGKGKIGRKSVSETPPGGGKISETLPFRPLISR